MFTGSITALITPFHDGEVDNDTFVALIERQIEAGTHGLVPAGTTGESPTLDHVEHNHVIELCVKTAAGRVPVIAGTGSNSTAEAIMTTRHAEKVGADAALVVVPYYNKPTQEGLFQHFKAIHDASHIPIILYDVPGRTVVGFAQETVERLAELPRVIGIKDATGDMKRPAALAKALKSKEKEFCQLSGNDDTVIAFMEQGGIGCISVTSNIMPKQCAEMHNLWQEGKQEEARMIQELLIPLHDVLFCETSPGPVKAAAAMMGLCRPEMRLPMVPVSEISEAKIRGVLEEMGLL